MTNLTSIHINKEHFDKIRGDEDHVWIAVLRGVNNEYHVPRNAKMTHVGWSPIFCMDDGFCFTLEVGATFSVVNESQSKRRNVEENEWFLVTEDGHEPIKLTDNGRFISHYEKVDKFNTVIDDTKNVLMYAPVNNGAKYFQVMNNPAVTEPTAVFEIHDGTTPVISAPLGSIIIVKNGYNELAVSLNQDEGRYLLDTSHFNKYDWKEIDCGSEPVQRKLRDYKPLHFGVNLIASRNPSFVACYDDYRDLSVIAEIKQPDILSEHSYETLVCLPNGMDIEVLIGSILQVPSSGSDILVTSYGYVDLVTSHVTWNTIRNFKVININPAKRAKEWVEDEIDFPENAKLYAVVPKDVMVNNIASFNKDDNNLKLTVGGVLYVESEQTKYMLIQLGFFRVKFSAETYFKNSNFDLISL